MLIKAWRIPLWQMRSSTTHMQALMQLPSYTAHKVRAQSHLTSPPGAWQVMIPTRGLSML